MGQNGDDLKLINKKGVTKLGLREFYPVTADEQDFK